MKRATPWFSKLFRLQSKLGEVGEVGGGRVRASGWGALPG